MPDSLVFSVINDLPESVARRLLGSSDAKSREELQADVLFAYLGRRLKGSVIIREYFK